MNNPQNEENYTQVLRRLARIESEVRSISHNDIFKIRTNKDFYIEELRTNIFNGARRVQIYLAVDGMRTATDISKLLNITPPHNVSREFPILQDAGLLDVVTKKGRSVVWGKTKIDRILKLSNVLMKEFGLDKNGLEEK